MSNWLIKLHVHLEKQLKKISKKKIKKLHKLSGNSVTKDNVSMSFQEHLDIFTFFNDFSVHCDNFSPNIVNAANLATLEPYSRDITCISNLSGVSQQDYFGHSSNHDINKTNSATLVNETLKGKFVSPNVVNVSRRNLTNDEISLLSKGLKFVPTTALIKEELEAYGRKLRLMWHFRNDEREVSYDPFKKNSKFDPKIKDAAIELYLSRLEEEISLLDYKVGYSNLTKEERDVIFSLKNESSLIIKEPDKGSAVVVWDRDDYFRETKNQLNDKNVYEELTRNVEGPLEKIIKTVLKKIRDRRDISDSTLDYFLVNNPKLVRFYLLPKIHKRLQNVPGRPVISNSGYYTENISAFLEFHLKPLAQKVKSYIKDTNDFLRKMATLPPLPDDIILCTIDVVGLYPNIPHDEGLIALRKSLESREDKTISTDSLMDLADCVFKNNIFEHNLSFFKQLRGTAVCTKMAPPYAIIFMGGLEERILQNCSFKPLVWWRYIDDIFLLWQYEEEKLKEFFDILNRYHPSIKFTSKYSRTRIDFLDVEIIKERNRLITDELVKSTDTHQYLHATSCHVYHSKKSIPYSQALRFNRICSENQFLDKRCNGLEEWLKNRGYN